MRALVAAVMVACATGAGAAPAPLRGAGMDAVDLFWHYVGQSPNNASFARESMRQACTVRNITLIRIAGTGFWPNDVAAWVKAPDVWWGAFRSMVGDAEAAGCRLVVDLYWNTFALPDLVGEPLHQALTNASSATRRLHLEYARGAVAAAAGSPAVVAWELTNELNLIQDLDLGVHQPSINPGGGTPERRTRADNVSTADVARWGQVMADYLRTIDPSRPVSGGLSTPRPAAFHLAQSYPHGKMDFTPDTEAQMRSAFATAQAPFDLASAHLYGGPGRDNVRFNATPVGPYWTGLVGILHEAALQMQPPRQLLLGEFGDPLPGTRPWTHAVLNTLVPGGPDLGLVWCFQFHQRSATVPANFSLEPGRDDATLGAIARTNAALIGGA